MNSFKQGHRLTAADVYNIAVGDAGLYEWQRNAAATRAGIVFKCHDGMVARLIEVASDTGNARISFVVKEGQVL